MNFFFFPEEIDLEIRVTRIERLLVRRAELLSSVLLRQNPHNVDEWLKRALLFEGNLAKVRLDALSTPVASLS
jgi:pre-mRNA-splicing factor SYF1